MAIPTIHVLAPVHRAATICTVLAAATYGAVRLIHAANTIIAPIMVVAISAFAMNPTRSSGPQGHAPTRIVPTEIKIQIGMAEATVAAAEVVEADGKLGDQKPRTIDRF